MAKDTQLTAHIHIVPLNDGEMPEGYTEGDRGTSAEHKKFDPYAKEILFNDPDSGEIIHYRMGGVMVKKIAAQLKMSNKALAAQLVEEVESARARAILAGGTGPRPNGGAGTQAPMTPAQIEQLRRNS
jgi:hypothetical protein